MSFEKSIDLIHRIKSFNKINFERKGTYIFPNNHNLSADVKKSYKSVYNAENTAFIINLMIQLLKIKTIALDIFIILLISYYA